MIFESRTRSNCNPYSLHINAAIWVQFSFSPTLCENGFVINFGLCLPLLSIGMWLHFMMASTAWATLGNSMRPEEERSVFSGNIRTAVGGTSLILKIPISCSSVRPGGVLKKWRICRREIISDTVPIHVVLRPAFTTHLARGLDPILAGLGWWQESVVLGAGELLEAGRVVWKTEGVCHLRQEILFGEPGGENRRLRLFQFSTLSPSLTQSGACHLYRQECCSGVGHTALRPPSRPSAP